ncbi:hypothetical protein G6F35_018922 [Rhizopus arrhizus]|nr:hypothetical protein G6F35_018922 [Rhizopus arrhizus]
MPPRVRGARMRGLRNGGARGRLVVRMHQLGQPHGDELLRTPAQDGAHGGIDADETFLRVDHRKQLR